MAKKRAQKEEPPTLVCRAAVPELIKRAREVAAGGLCLGFKDVAQAMGEDGKTLRLWAGASERDEIDRMCAKAREPMRKRGR